MHFVHCIGLLTPRCGWPKLLQEANLSELAPSCTIMKGSPGNESHSFPVAGCKRAEKRSPTGHCFMTCCTAGNISRTDWGDSIQWHNCLVIAEYPEEAELGMTP